MLVLRTGRLQPLNLDWWPLSRDAAFYFAAVLSILLVFMDGEVHWYEGLAFFMLYMVYIGFMSQNERIATMARKMVSGTKVHSGGNADEPDNAKGALNADAGEKDGDEDTKVGNLQVCTLTAITTTLLMPFVALLFGSPRLKQQPSFSIAPSSWLEDLALQPERYTRGNNP